MIGRKRGVARWIVGKPGVVQALRIAPMLGVVLAASLQGQPRPDEVRFHVGTATFFEAPQHVTAGGAYRKYIGGRGWAIEPEYSAMFVPAHTDNMLAVNVAKDLSRPTARRVWYTIMGAGINLQTGAGRTKTYWGAVAWGIGAKVQVGERWSVAPQVRIGIEPNLRFSVFIGWKTRSERQ